MTLQWPHGDRSKRPLRSCDAPDCRNWTDRLTLGTNAAPAPSSGFTQHRGKDYCADHAHLRTGR